MMLVVKLICSSINSIAEGDRPLPQKLNDRLSALIENRFTEEFMRKRPNILFAIADDASHFGIYGHSFVHTPNIDALAKKGVIFENAFTSNPKCAPSRASILTGRYPWQNREACNHFCVFPAGLTLMPDVLEDNGYFIGYTGKGWAPGDFKRNGLKRNPAGNCFNEYKLEPPEGSGIRKFDYTENFRDFLDSNKDGKPFYFWYGCREPHRPYIYKEGERAGKRMDEITALPSYWPDTEEVRNDVLDYASEIEWYDMHLGNMINILRERGLLEDTLIVVTSDNGCPFPRVKGQMYEQDFHLPFISCWGDGSHGGRRVSDIINFVDIMPTFLEVAGVEIPDSVSGNSFYDILVSDKSGLIDSSRNITYFGREKHDIGRRDDLGYPVRCVRTEKYLYSYNFAPDRWPAGNPETGYTNVDSSPTKDTIIKLHEEGDDSYYLLSFGFRPQEELFDITQDEECLNNLAYLPEYDTVRRELHDKLFNFLEKTEDPRLEDPDYFERFEYAGKDDHSWKAYVEGRFKPM